MCRMAGWTGTSRPLSQLLYDPDRSLSTQAWDPHEMLYGNVNVDGTGVIWWPEGQREQPPLRYATAAAAWNDGNLPALAPRLHAETIIAAVRSATPGIAFGPANVAPFVRGNLGLTHNGFIEGFRKGVGRVLLSQLSDQAFNEFDAVSDSQVILLLVRTHMAQGLSLTQAIQATLVDVTAAVDAAGVGATLNLLASDGDVLVATRASVGLEHNSLYVMTDAHGTTIASEPLSSEGLWEKVAPQSLLVARGTSVTTVAID